METHSPLIRSESAVCTRELPPHPLLQVVQTNCVLAETIVLFMVNRHGGWNRNGRARLPSSPG